MVLLGKMSKFIHTPCKSAVLVLVPLNAPRLKGVIYSTRFVDFGFLLILSSVIRRDLSRIVAVIITLAIY